MRARFLPVLCFACTAACAQADSYEPIWLMIHCERHADELVPVPYSVMSTFQRYWYADVSLAEAIEPIGLWGWTIERVTNDEVDAWASLLTAELGETYTRDSAPLTPLADEALQVAPMYLISVTPRNAPDKRINWDGQAVLVPDTASPQTLALIAHLDAVCDQQVALVLERAAAEP